MKNAAKLDDFAHDICVSGLAIAFVSVVGISMLRPGTDARRAPRNDVPAPISWTEAGTPSIAAGSLAGSSVPRSGEDHARGPDVFAIGFKPAAEPQRILLAGESGAESTAER